MSALACLDCRRIAAGKARPFATCDKHSAAARGAFSNSVAKPITFADIVRTWMLIKNMPQVLEYTSPVAAVKPRPW